MRRNKHRIKQLSLYLAVLTLFLFASCGTEPEREDQVVSERAVELFNLGIASYQEENFSGESRAYAVLKKTGEEAGSYSSYLQMTRGLYRNDQEEPAFRLSVRGFINSPMPRFSCRRPGIRFIVQIDRRNIIKDRPRGFAFASLPLFRRDQPVCGKRLLRSGNIEQLHSGG